MFEASPMERLLMYGTKNLKALDKSELVEDIIFTMQYYSKNYEFLLPLLDVISSCVLYKNLAQKFSNFGILKDIVNDLYFFSSFFYRYMLFSIVKILEAILLNPASKLFGIPSKRWESTQLNFLQQK